MSMEEDGIKARSFRDEDYSTRRVFLRSYPLHWGDTEAEEVGWAADEGVKDVPAEVTKTKNGKKVIKKIILSVIQWGEGSILVFRRFKLKIVIYAVSCTPTSFRDHIALISAK